MRSRGHQVSLAAQSQIIKLSPPPEWETPLHPQSPKRHIPKACTQCQESGITNTESSWHVSTLTLTRTIWQSELNHCLPPHLINVNFKYLMSRECEGEGQRYSSFFSLPLPVCVINETSWFVVLFHLGIDPSSFYVLGKCSELDYILGPPFKNLFVKL